MDKKSYLKIDVDFLVEVWQKIGQTAINIKYSQNKEEIDNEVEQLEKCYKLIQNELYNAESVK